MPLPALEEIEDFVCDRIAGLRVVGVHEATSGIVRGGGANSLRRSNGVQLVCRACSSRFASVRYRSFVRKPRDDERKLVRFPFFFPVAHYWTAYVVFGALLIHATDEWAKVRRLGHRAPEPPGSGLGRRGFLATVAGACGLVALTTVGETFTPLGNLAVLAPRRPGNGPQRLPVNKTALAAGVTRQDGWRLAVTGAVRRGLHLSIEDLRAMPQHVVRLPIACVEGWSAEATWAGVRLRDVLRAAGVAHDARVRVESLEKAGLYRASDVDPPHWHDEATLLALDVNGEPLGLDHGYPCRLIAPGRPGVMQTKWVAALVVT